MIATIRRTAPAVSPEPVESPKSRTKRRRAWAPNADDHQIYHWVRFEGKQQHWVAYQMGVSQATVSRVIQRYERWKAHAEPRDGGELDPAERARAQWWLTYERNEIVIASALRLAAELEGFTDVSKSVTTYPLHHPSQESQVRQESQVIDRSGMVARFLRIVHRVGLDQQKHVQSQQPPKPEPLSEEEIAREACDAAEDREEKRQSLAAAEAHRNACRRKELEVLGDAEALAQFDEQCAAEAARSAAQSAAEREAEETAQWIEEEEEVAPRLAVVAAEEVVGSAGSAEPESAEGRPSEDRLTEKLGTEKCEVGSAGLAEPVGRCDERLPIEVPPSRRDLQSGVFMQVVHKMHTQNGKKMAASDQDTSSCVEKVEKEDFCGPDCIASPRGLEVGPTDDGGESLGWKDGKREDTGDRAPRGGVQRDEPGGDAVHRRFRQDRGLGERGPAAEGAI